LDDHSALRTLHLAGPPEFTALRALPALTGIEISGRTVRIRSTDADATVHAVYGLGLYPHGLEVTGLGLEQAFLAITDAAAAVEESAR
ncbi:ABC transporter ATP-binding protein, partial [Streptomyces rubiginosohelvolus]